MIYSLQTHIQMYVDPYEYIYISISIPVFKTYAASHMALAVKNLPANAGALLEKSKSNPGQEKSTAGIEDPGRIGICFRERRFCDQNSGEAH